MSEQHILLVEDDENDVFFFRRAADQAGLQKPIHVVRDGCEAVDYLEGKGEFSDREKHPMPVLIILDLNLPHRNGLEVLKCVRANPATKTKLVIVFTSSTSERDIHEAYALGANSYLLKPTHPDRTVELLKLIRLYWLAANQTPPSNGIESLPDARPENRGIT